MVKMKGDQFFFFLSFFFFLPGSPQLFSMMSVHFNYNRKNNVGFFLLFLFFMNRDIPSNYSAFTPQVFKIETQTLER